MPILTLYTLTNFSLVFLSCVFTVMVLRLYYKTPSYLSPAETQLPYLFRLILFKYIAPMLCLKFYFRKRDELYSSFDDYSRFYFGDKKKKKSRKKSSIDEQFNIASLNLNDCTTSFEALTGKKESGEDIFKNTYQLLNTLRLLNKCMRFNASEELPDSQNRADRLNNSKENQLEKSLYYEEWKQASLVLDRYKTFKRGFFN